MRTWRKFMKKIDVSINQAKDSGLAIMLILLLFIYFGKQDILILPTIFVLIIIFIKIRK